MPVAKAVHKMGPATTAEILADHVTSRSMVPFDSHGPSLQHPGEQQRSVDATDVSDAVPVPLTPDAAAPPTSRRRTTSRPRHEPPRPIVHEIDQDVFDELGHNPRSDVMNAGQLFRT